MIRFTIPTDPVAQGRPRTAVIAGRAQIYDPAKSRTYKNLVSLFAADAHRGEPLTGPLAVTITVYRAMPKSFSVKKAQAAEEGKILPVSKPDATNYAKSVEDGCNGILWRDDSQIVSLRIEKRYSIRPRVEVEVQEVQQ